MIKLTEIQKLILEAKYDEALAACDDLSQNHPELLLDVLRQRSHVYSRQASYELAVDQLSQIIDSGEATIGDFQSAAFWALYDGQLKRALDWYLIVLKMGDDQNEKWFRSNALSLIAYINMELGEFDKAIYYLDEVATDDKDSSFLIPIIGFCEVKQLRDQIRLRAVEK